jgi:hypothetical protein
VGQRTMSLLAVSMLIGREGGGNRYRVCEANGIVAKIGNISVAPRNVPNFIFYVFLISSNPVVTDILYVYFFP